VEVREEAYREAGMMEEMISAPSNRTLGPRGRAGSLP
jgi:hypothetical protein